MVRKKQRYRNSYFRVRFVIMVFSALFLSTSIIFGILVINGTESVAASGNSGIIRVNRWPESGETTGLNKKIVRLTETARKQLGEESGKKYWTWYGYENPVDWCGCFVSWCISQAGMTEAGGAPKFSYCQDGILWFSERGLWLPPDSSPRAGMIVFFDWDGNGVSDHVGIVSESGAESISVIEGDCGGRCTENSYAQDDKRIMGYGCYAEIL